jgi:lysophospholipase L1-like esterase
MTVCLLGGALACPWVARAEAEGVPGVGRPIRIACIGDSITDFDTYETNLQNMLNAAYALSGKHPPKYEVRNFGVSGTTALDQSASYMKTAKYRDALACNPDIVYIQLGTNDSRRGKTYDSIGQFAGDYTRLVKSFLELPGKPRVYLSAPPTMPNEGHWGDNDLTLVTGVIPRIHAVARTFNLPVIDQHTPTSGHPEWVSDNVHPSRETAGRVMAAALYRAITGLQPPATLYPPVWFVPTSNLLASKTPVQDIKAILEAHKPGDYFLAGRVRLGSLTSGSQTATLTIALVDDKGKHAFSSERGDGTRERGDGLLIMTRIMPLSGCLMSSPSLSF